NQATEEEISSILESFTAVNVLRRGYNNNYFENIGFVIMTGSWIKLQISADVETKLNSGDFSFATNIFYVTQRLWFKLNRGLALKSNLPFALTAVSKAQMLLSNHLNASVRERYKKLELEVESGNLTIESAQEYYKNLRSNVTKPEELVPESVEAKVKFLFEVRDIEHFQEEQSLLKKKAKAYDQILASKAADEEIVKLKQRRKLIKEFSILQNRAKRQKKSFKWFFWIFIVLLGFAIIFSILKISTEKDTIIAIIGLGISALGLLSSLIRIEKINQLAANKFDRKVLNFIKEKKISSEEIRASKKINPG
ncbi:MAG: hypothetical protein ACI83I_001010, partial [Bacteroidia bacterium]